MGSNGNSVEKVLDFHKILAIVKKNWMVLKSDALRLRVLFIFPLVMILLFGFTAGKTPKHIPAAIADYDHTGLSDMVASQLYANDLFSISQVVGSQDEGKKLIDEGAIKILFVIPSGFESDVLAGRPASISIIIDESDPSVAQVTRAFTQVFIEGLSKTLTAQKVAALSAQASAFSGYLSDAGASVSVPDARPGEQALSGAGAYLIDAKQVAAGTDRTVDVSTMDMKNTLGPIFDRNQIVYEYENNISTRAATYDMLTASDAQQPTLQQIALYKGFQGTADRIARDAAGIYSSSRTLYAQAQAARQAVAVSALIMDSAGKKAAQIAESAGAIPVDAITLNEIEPYGSGRPGLDFLIPSILALIVFQGAVMAMGRAIAGERQDGSLTRVFLTPTSNTTIIAGTLLFYVIFETVRSSLIVLAAMLIFGVTIKGGLLDIFLLIAIYAAGATGLGMILSVMAKTQEQYMALGMLVSLPTIFLAGVFIPIETMPPVLQGFTDVLPITYAADALRGIIIKGFTLGQVVPDIVALCVFALITLAMSIALFKRELI